MASSIATRLCEASEPRHAANHAREQPIVIQCRDGAGGLRGDENAPHLSGNTLGRKLLESPAQLHGGFEPSLIHVAFAVIRVEAEEAENAQIVFFDARFGIADEVHAPSLQIAIAAERIEHLAVSIGVERIQREVAALGVLLPRCSVGDLGVPAIRLDVAPERGDLERRAVGDDGNRAVIDPGRHGLEPSPLGKRDDLLRLRRGGQIDRLVTGSPRSVSRTAPPTTRVSTPSGPNAVNTARVPGRVSHSASASEGAPEPHSS